MLKKFFFILLPNIDSNLINVEKQARESITKLFQERLKKKKNKP